MQTCAVSPHPIATAIGNDLLERGASAAEAAVAIGAYLSVAMPHFCGIGGDAVWLVSDGAGHVQAINGIGQAFDFTSGVTQIATRGPQSILTTAAATATWDAALQIFGVTPDLGMLLGPAQQAARDGIRVTPSQDFWRGMRADEMQDWPGFTPYARAKAGDLLLQPDLATSLQALIDHGLSSFHTGPLSRRILDDLQSLGVAVTANDLAATRAAVEAPLSLPYRGTQLYAPPPPTQGVTTLQIMGILERLKTPATYHLMVEAVKRAFLDRPALDDQAQVADWLSEAHLARLAANIDPMRAMPWPHEWNSADTVYFAARDAQGGCVSALQSTYFDWGSGCVLPQTGMIWHNRGAGFSLNAGPNRLAPRRRPFHTLNPGIATRDGKPWLLYGTQGADGQPQTLAVILQAAIDQGLPPEAALSVPRFLLGRTFSDGRDTLKLEPTGQEDALAALGHQISPIPALSQLAGQAGMIRIEAAVTGAHDPRGRV
ncbi:gamma-glutamyltransferase family protein [Ketogulonicigenium vulgare]|uniref:gamma-glutamyltransferase family protein n=1 Tax=Ketogulonicigenium vulgare TaxID=92945 RepID=UPI002359A5BE|nr:gamma-glutamyltransferase [Ketogulonicigenium vulgare]